MFPKLLDAEDHLRALQQRSLRRRIGVVLQDVLVFNDTIGNIIAHRLSTVVGANRILVLKDGAIIEADNHEALMRRDGYYASLVRHQSRGLLLAA
jgi:ABC-type multidrug transport system fused ATPase/permease subunit